MGCIFCGIASGEIPAYKILENDNALAFLDVDPLILGHTVVIPKKHYGNIADLPEDLIEPVFLSVKKATEMLMRGLGVEGFTIGINHGTIAHQTVDHLHVHVVPRRSGDGGGSIHSIVKNPPVEPLEETQRRILEANK